MEPNNGSIQPVSAPLLPGLINAGIDCIEHGSLMSDATLDLYGLKRGTVQITTDDGQHWTAIGDTVNLASRLEANAQGGQILLSAAAAERTLLRTATGHDFSNYKRATMLRRPTAVKLLRPGLDSESDLERLRADLEIAVRYVPAAAGAADFEEPIGRGEERLKGFHGG